jgi:hypothetical protein
MLSFQLRAPGLRCLKSAVATLLLVWQFGCQGEMRESGQAEHGPMTSCISRCRKLFERLFQACSEEVLTEIIENTVSDGRTVPVRNEH